MRFKKKINQLSKCTSLTNVRIFIKTKKIDRNDRQGQSMDEL